MSIEGKRALIALRAEAAAVAAEQDPHMTPAEVEAFVDGYVTALSRATEPEPEWEYRYAEMLDDTQYTYEPSFATWGEANAKRVDEAEYVVRRRKAGPWEPVVDATRGGGDSE